MTQGNDDQIVSIFEEAVKELLKFHCENNFPFYKEAEVQAWLYMKVYEELEKKDLLFHKCKNCERVSEDDCKGRLIIRLLAKYPKAKNSKNNEKLELSDFAITSSDFCPYEKATKQEKPDGKPKKEQNWIDASKYKYLIMVEIKSWNNYSKDDIKKLSDSTAQNKYFILLGDEYKKNKGPEAPRDILKPTGSPKQVYTLNETSARRYKDCNIYYGLIYSKDRFGDKDKCKIHFKLKKKGNLHVYANRGLISS